MSAGSSDTIVAPATASGRGAVGIVRLSGPECRRLAERLCGRTPVARRATLVELRDAAAQRIDQALALSFDAPRSYTGEDVLELHCHGGQMVVELIVARCLELGARLARPGEFTERAYHHGRLDLAQAEAVADLIDAGSRAAVLAAARSLRGDFSHAVDALVEALIAFRMRAEAAIDFPDEDLDLPDDADAVARLDDLRHRLAALLVSARQGQRLRDGLTVVIAGRPNSGKSSLLNRLAGRDVAIVTPIAGTTRDVLRTELQLDGLPLHVLDTAGLRDTDDPVETEGVRRARLEIRDADLVLTVVDATDPALPELPTDAPAARLWVLNKIDCVADAAESAARLATRLTNAAADAAPTVLPLSALTGEGVDGLRAELRRSAGFQGPASGEFSARRRHVDALRRAATALDAAAARLRERAPAELVAEEARLAQQALGEITGQLGSDDLLGRIFADFCIGK
jgi:tRNA modification GTPase